MANANNMKDKFLLAAGDIVEYNGRYYVGKLNKIEEKYYSAINKEERVKAYNDKSFQKLSDLQPGEIYKIKNSKEKYYIRIMEKAVVKDELLIKYMTEEGQTHYKSASLFKEIPVKPKKTKTKEDSDMSAGNNDKSPLAYIGLPSLTSIGRQVSSNSSASTESKDKNSNKNKSEDISSYQKSSSMNRQAPLVFCYGTFM